MANLNFSSPDIAKRVEEWSSGRHGEEMAAEVKKLVQAGDVKELEERFYRTLEFGTGGLRGVLGAGTNRMNAVVVSQATQGLANYVKAHATRPEPFRAVIGHDSRHRSRDFAEASAAVLAANGFEVFLCPEIRPTPWVSYACRELQCHTAIMITASHNPKQYNGYKCYWDDGSQVVPPHDKGIIAEVDKVNAGGEVKTVGFDDAVKNGSIQITGKELDEKFLDAVLAQRLDADAVKQNQVSLVYTPLHGVGGTMVPEALRRWGFTNVHTEPEQMKPDGDFPTAKSPNPEEGEALENAIALAKKVEGEVVLATDPDADRLGIAVRHDGDYHLVTGNQLAVLLGDYLLTKYKGNKVPGAVSTIVTTPLLRQVVESHDGKYEECLTGFKWIADVARRWKKERPDVEFLYGTEESYGYLIGDHAMDKDGVVACCLTGEMAAWLKGQGKTIIDYLDEIYLRFEPRVEWQKSVVMPGREGAEKIASLMKTLMEDPPKEIAGKKVVRRTRVDTGKVYDGQTGKETGTIGLPSSKVVVFDLEDGSKAVGRPSGTEPKIKFYFFLLAEKQKDLAGVRAARETLKKQKDEFQSAFLKAIGAE